jgi:hypothetical protein
MRGREVDPGQAFGDASGTGQPGIDGRPIRADDAANGADMPASTSSAIVRITRSG